MTQISESVNPPRNSKRFQDASLGTTYEIAQPPPLNQPIEPIYEKQKKDEQVKACLHRLERFRLQNVARSLLPDERVSSCLRSVIKSHVSVLRSKDKAHYKGLIVCGSSWHDPVCAAKITERRRQDLVRGMETWKASGGVVLMMTQTVPHCVFQPLKTVLEGLLHARLLLRNRKPFKRIAKRIDLAGTVRSLETTYGENGWHVHVHELLFLKDLVERESLQDEMLSQWKSACTSSGLNEPNERGIRIDDGAQAGSYASKWGLDHEMTKSHIKRGLKDNVTPWDLLRMFESSEIMAGSLFREYAKEFKGKRQLVYSKGLRDLLGLDEEKTDVELATEVEEEAELLGRLTRREWGLVVAAEKRGELLEVAVSDGWPGVVRLVGDLIRASGACPF